MKTTLTTLAVACVCACASATTINPCNGGYVWNAAMNACCKTNLVTVTLGGAPSSGGSPWSIPASSGSSPTSTKNYLQTSCQIGAGMPGGFHPYPPPLCWPPETNIYGGCTVDPPAPTAPALSASFTNQVVDSVGSVLLNRPVYFDSMFADVLSEVSTNLVNWQSYHTITGWVSDAGVLCILYRQSVPIQTNLYLSSYAFGMATNSTSEYWLYYTNLSGPKAFFRIKSD